MWQEKGILRPIHYAAIQEKIDMLNIPYGVGRIPYKIMANFSGITANQWKNWTNLYSLYALKDILPSEDYKCWSYFVYASQLLCQLSISLEELERANSNLLKFCKSFESLYGKESCTPNIHLHCHLKQCVQDYSPIASFWAFPFERYNGIMESFNKNWLTHELQMMCKFISYQKLLRTNSTLTVIEEYQDLVGNCFDLSSGTSGSINQSLLSTQQVPVYNGNVTCLPAEINASYLPFHEILSKTYENYFKSYELNG